MHTKKKERSGFAVETSTFIDLDQEDLTSTFKKKITDPNLDLE